MNESELIIITKEDILKKFNEDGFYESIKDQAYTEEEFELLAKHVLMQLIFQEDVRLIFADKDQVNKFMKIIEQKWNSIKWHMEK